MFLAKVNGFALDDLSGKPVLQSRFACQCFISSALRFNFPSFPALLCLAFLVFSCFVLPCFPAPTFPSLPFSLLPHCTASCQAAIFRSAFPSTFFVPLRDRAMRCYQNLFLSECKKSAVYAEKARKNTVFLFFYAFVPIGFRLRFRL